MAEVRATMLGESAVLRPDQDAQHLPRRDEEGTGTSVAHARPVSQSDRQAKQTDSAPQTHRRRRLGVALLLLGLIGILAGYLMGKTETRSIPTHRFTPTSAERAVVSTGGTAAPSLCPDSVANSAPDYGLAISPAAANVQFTLYPGDLFSLYEGSYEHVNYVPEISASAPVCVFDAAGPGGAQIYDVERPGTVVIYFVGNGSPVQVVKIVASASSPPSTLPGWTLLALGALLCLVGLVLIRRRRAAPSDDLRRADDASRGPGFDPQAAQRAAWDYALDQTSGQY